MTRKCEGIKERDSKFVDSSTFKLKLRKLMTRIWIDRYLFLLTLPAIIYYIIFQYLPMCGILIAFEDYSPRLGIFGSPWVGLQWFKQFFSSVYAWRVIKNTLW